MDAVFNDHVVSTHPPVWSILSLIETAASFLGEKGIESARLNAELLLSKVLLCERIDLYLKFDQVLTEAEVSQFRSYVQRRLNREPLQYVLGETNFMGLRVAVDRRVFIPRPETEVLVEQIIRFAKRVSPAPQRILDVGTGSGNIAVSLAMMIPHSRVDAVDVSADALEVAETNVRRHQLTGRISLLQIDFLQDTQLLASERYDIVVSNPPYISAKEFATVAPEIREFEPTVACTDRGDGLTFFRSIAQQGRRLLSEDGCLFVEIGFGQSKAVQEIFRESNYSAIEIVPDYAGIDRVLVAHR